MSPQNAEKNTNTHKFQFNKVTDTTVLEPLKAEWRKSLTAPQDDMWETFTNYADHWHINVNTQTIGYACVNDENRLLQFYVTPEWMPEGNAIFEHFVHQQKIKKAIIGTNNPLCFSIAMHLQKSVQIHYYLFSDFLQEKVIEKEGTIKSGKIKDIEKFVDFTHESTGGPKQWLEGYLSTLINKGGYFIFENNGEILGAFEVRKSDTYPKTAHLGMVVSPNHRKKGLGTFLLGKAKETAREWNLQPICGCDQDNIGSLKSIHKNGFRIVHQMMLLKFEAE
jgi:predicted acetyltransferase